MNDPVRQLVYAERGAGLGFSMVAGEIAIERGVLTRIDEAALLREIENEFESLRPQYAKAEAEMTPVLEAVEAIHREALATPVAPDTYNARLNPSMSA